MRNNLGEIWNCSFYTGGRQKKRALLHEAQRANSCNFYLSNFSKEHQDLIDSHGRQPAISA